MFDINVSFVNFALLAWPLSHKREIWRQDKSRCNGMRHKAVAEDAISSMICVYAGVRDCGKASVDVTLAKPLTDPTVSTRGEVKVVARGRLLWQGEVIGPWFLQLCLIADAQATPATAARVLTTSQPETPTRPAAGLAAFFSSKKHIESPDCETPAASTFSTPLRPSLPSAPMAHSVAATLVLPPDFPLMGKRPREECEVDEADIDVEQQATE